MQYITPEKLREMNACEKEVKKFEEFLEEKGWSRARPTYQNLKEAQNYGLNVVWAVEKKLVPKEVVLKEAKWVFYYALEACKQTRDAACQDAEWAYKYALYVDEEACKQTRDAVCQNPDWAYKYALYVDEEPHKQTREAVKGHFYEDVYDNYFSND